MSSIVFLSLLSSLIITMALIPPLMRLAGPLRLIDLPGDRRIHAAPIGRVGGVALAIGALTAIWLFVPADRLVVSCLAGSLIILAFGVLDDRVSLGFMSKLLGQGCAAVIAAWYGGARFHCCPLVPDDMVPGWLSLLLTILVIVSVTNAINLADGLDGLAGGLSFISLTGIAYLAYAADDMSVMLIATSLVGGVLGFLRSNTHPARLFMGDSGSQFLGFYLSILIIELTDPSRAHYSSALAPLIVGLPLLDMAYVMTARFVQGRSPFEGDKTHFHHKLLSMGFSQPMAVTIIYVLQTVMIVSGCLLRWQGDAVVVAVYGILAAAILFFFVAGSGRWRLVYHGGQQSVGRAMSGFMQLSRRARELPIRLLGIGVMSFLLIGAFIPTRVSTDFGYAAAGMVVVLGLGALVFPRAIPLFVRCGLYVGGAFAVYLCDQSSALFEWPFVDLMNIFFGLLALLSIITAWFDQGQRFQITPLDYLMVLLALVICTVPGLRLGDADFGLLTAKLLILFVSFEMMMSAFDRFSTQLGLVSLWLFFALGIRAWS